MVLWLNWLPPMSCPIKWSSAMFLLNNTNGCQGYGRFGAAGCHGDDNQILTYFLMIHIFEARIAGRLGSRILHYNMLASFKPNFCSFSHKYQHRSQKDDGNIHENVMLFLDSKFLFYPNFQYLHTKLLWRYCALNAIFFKIVDVSYYNLLEQ